MNRRARLHRKAMQQRSDQQAQTPPRGFEHTQADQRPTYQPETAVQDWQPAPVNGYSFAELSIHIPLSDVEIPPDNDPQAELLAVLDELKKRPSSELPYRTELEKILGQPLGDVQVYSGDEPRQVLERLEARAAVYDNILLLAEPDPPLDLLLHEAVHLLQARQATDPGSEPGEIEIIARESPLEIEASRAQQLLHTQGEDPGKQLDHPDEAVESGKLLPNGGGGARVRVENSLPSDGIALQRSETANLPPVQTLEKPLRPGFESWVIAPEQRFEEAAAHTSPVAQPADAAPAATAPSSSQPSPEGPAEVQVVPPEEALPSPGLQPAEAPAAAEPDMTAQEQARIQAEAAVGSAEDVSGLIEAYAAAPPTVKARQAASLGERAGGLSQQEAQSLEQSVPEIRAELNTQVEEAPPLQVEAPAGREVTLEDTPPAPTELPVLPPTPDPGRYNANEGVAGVIERALNIAGGDPSTQIGESLSEVRTTDPQIPDTPGPPPQVPLEGEIDPARLEEQTASGVEQARSVRNEGSQAVLSGPGPEQVQPLQMDDAQSIGVLERPVLEAPPHETAPADSPEAYLGMDLPPEVQARFDQDQQGAMQASMERAQAQVSQAASERDNQRQERVDEAQAESNRLSQQADEEQRLEVQSARQDIQNERQSTIDQQNEAVQSLENDAESRRQEDRADIDGRVQDDQSQIESEYTQAETDANHEIQDGEHQAEERRADAEREASEQSWWDQAVSFVRDAFNALVSTINVIFDAVRNAVNAILDAAKAFAERVIAAAAEFIKSAIAAYGEFLKGLVDALLGDFFPGLAAALNQFIDTAVAAVQSVVDAVANALRAAINSLIEGLRAGLNAIINAYQAAVQMCLALVEAALTGDWSALARKALEAILHLIGVDPEQFYAFIGRAMDTIQIIIDDPGGFLGHLLDAFLGGIRQFGINFLTHLQASIIDWLTGALGSTGITLPERFDMMGVLSLVQQILGLTWDQLRQKAVRLIGERNVAILEFVYSYIETLVTGGFPALFERILQDLSGLVDTVLGAIRNFLVERIIMAAITRLATLFSPVGATVQLVLAAWNFYTFLRDQLSSIILIVQTVVDAIGNIARGIIDPAINAVEGMLGRLLTFVIDLLARFLGLGGIADRVREIIETIRARVDQAIDNLLNRVRDMFHSEETAAASGAEPPPGAGTDAGQQADVQLSGNQLSFEFSAGREHHRIWIEMVHGRSQMLIASETEDFDLFTRELTERIALLENGEEKTRLLGQIEEARSLSTTVETEQSQAATRAASATGVTSPQLSQEENIRRQVGRLIDGLRGVMVRASQIPRDFTPGHIQYSPRGDRAGRAQGWLANNAAPRSGGDQAAVSGPLNQFITRLRAEGVTADATFDAGHLIGSRYGGDGTRHNLVPMESRMNRSWFNAFEARVNTHVEQGEAVYADIEASYSGNPLERLVNAEDLTPAQTLAALPVFENIPQAINVRIGRRTGDASDQPLFNETFDPRERLALTISRARSGIVGETFGGRARDIFEEES